MDERDDVIEYMCPKCGSSYFEEKPIDFFTDGILAHTEIHYVCLNCRHTFWQPEAILVRGEDEAE